MSVGLEASQGQRSRSCRDNPCHSSSTTPPSQFLSSLVGLAGIIGLFAHLFKVSERLQGVIIAQGAAVAPVRGKSSVANVLSQSRPTVRKPIDEGDLVDTVNPLRLRSLPPSEGSTAVPSSHSFASAVVITPENIDHTSPVRSGALDASFEAAAERRLQPLRRGPGQSS